MKKFDVEITETLQRTVSVEAASQEEAERMVTESYSEEKRQTAASEHSDNDRPCHADPIQVCIGTAC